VESVLLNYKKCGKQFWNQIQMQHLRDFSSKTSLIVGVQIEVYPNLESKLTRQVSHIMDSERERSVGGSSNESDSSSNNVKTQLTLLVESNTSSRSGSSSSSGSLEGDDNRFHSESSGSHRSGRSSGSARTDSDGCGLSSSIHSSNASASDGSMYSPSDR